jgi:hypothetical protein
LRQKARSARRERSTKRLHSLRKTLKRHTALQQTLAPLVEGVLDQERLEALAAHLGKLNDLEDLKKQCKKARGEVPKRELRSLKQRVVKRQAKELRVSQKLARKLSRKPHSSHAGSDSEPSGQDTKPPVAEVSSPSENQIEIGSN